MTAILAPADVTFAPTGCIGDPERCHDCPECGTDRDVTGPPWEPVSDEQLGLDRVFAEDDVLWGYTTPQLSTPGGVQ